MKLQAVLLDIDGTLLDSNDAHADSWATVLHRYGYTDCDRGRIRSMIGMGADKMLPELIGKGPGDSGFDRLCEERTTLFLRDYLPALRPTPGARQLMERMKEDGLSLVVATSAGQELQTLLEQAGVADLIDVSASSEDARNSKPDADIVVAALKKRRISARQAMMLGDTPYDICAARGAGVPCVALRCGGWWRDADFRAATAIFDDPGDLLHAWPLTLVG